LGPASSYLHPRGGWVGSHDHHVGDRHYLAYGEIRERRVLVDRIRVPAYVRECASPGELQRIGLRQSRAVLGWEGWREAAAPLGIAALGPVSRRLSTPAS
jgi:hypothetical protein